MSRPPRREHPAPLPDIAKVRIIGDDQAVQRLVEALAGRYVCTEPAHYSGGRAYLEVDTSRPT